MPISAQSRQITVSLLMVPEISAAVVFSLNEVFSYAGKTGEIFSREPSNCRFMVPRLVASTTEPVSGGSGVTLVANHTFDEAHRSDVVIVSDLIVDADKNPIGGWPDAVAWVKSQHEQGAIVCSVCTGSIMLAEAGLLDGKEATTHWYARRLFEDYYPQVLLRPERILVSTGEEHRIVTGGGTSAWAELALYLIARFCGEQEARRIAKFFIIGDKNDGQLPFAAMAQPKQHEDAIIARTQEWVADNYAQSNPVTKMAEKSGLTARTFKRRFAATTGYAPLEYVQSLRIEEAKQILETTNDPIDDVAMNVGYGEPNSFRRLFKRTTGITPHQYRVRFQGIVSRIAV